MNHAISEALKLYCFLFSLPDSLWYSQNLLNAHQQNHDIYKALQAATTLFLHAEHAEESYRQNHLFKSIWMLKQFPSLWKSVSMSLSAPPSTPLRFNICVSRNNPNAIDTSKRVVCVHCPLLQLHLFKIHRIRRLAERQCCCTVEETINVGICSCWCI